MSILMIESCVYLVMQEGLKQCLADFRKDLPWVERLDLTNLPAEDVLSKVEAKVPNVTNGNVTVDDDFQREMFLWVTITWFAICRKFYVTKQILTKQFHHRVVELRLWSFWSNNAILLSRQSCYGNVDAQIYFFLSTLRTSHPYCLKFRLKVHSSNHLQFFNVTLTVWITAIGSLRQSFDIFHVVFQQPQKIYVGFNECRVIIDSGWKSTDTHIISTDLLALFSQFTL